MRLMMEELIHLLNDEKETVKFLYKRKKDINGIGCPHCGGRKFYLMSRKESDARDTKKTMTFLKKRGLGR